MTSTSTTSTLPTQLSQPGSLTLSREFLHNSFLPNYLIDVFQLSHHHDQVQHHSGHSVAPQSQPNCPLGPRLTNATPNSVCSHIPNVCVSTLTPSRPSSTPWWPQRGTTVSTQQSFRISTYLCLFSRVPTPFVDPDDQDGSNCNTNPIDSGRHDQGHRHQQPQHYQPNSINLAPTGSTGEAHDLPTPLWLGPTSICGPR